MGVYNINENRADFYKSLKELADEIRLENKLYQIKEETQYEENYCISFRCFLDEDDGELVEVVEEFCVFFDKFQDAYTLNYTSNLSKFTMSHTIRCISDFYWNEDGELMVIAGGSHIKMFGDYLPKNGKSLFWVNGVKYD